MAFGNLPTGLKKITFEKVIDERKINDLQRDIEKLGDSFDRRKFLLVVF